jgi:hypothetical protein
MKRLRHYSIFPVSVGVFCVLCKLHWIKQVSANQIGPAGSIWMMEQFFFMQLLAGYTFLLILQLFMQAVICNGQSFITNGFH